MAYSDSKIYSDPQDLYTEAAVYYTATAVQQQALYDLLLDAANSWLRLLPGFLSANVYRGKDGTHIVSQVEWRTREDWQHSLQHPEREAIHSKFQVGGKIFRAGPGSTVFGPRNIPHRFCYAGESGVGRLIVMYTPAGIERAFLQHDEWAANGTDITPEMLKNLADNIGAYPLQDLDEYLSKNS